MTKSSVPRTTSVRAKKHDALTPLIDAMFREFQELAKKKPDAVLNMTKVKTVNRLLKDLFEILDGEDTRQYLDMLNEDDMPQYSDVVIILGQTRAAMQSFHDKYYGGSDRGYGWGV